jgi:hypothetical protein
MRDGVAAETALNERDWADGGDAVRTHGTVRPSPCNDDDRSEGADQDDSNQPCHPSPGYHRRPHCLEDATFVITTAASRQVRDRDLSGSPSRSPRI